MLARFDRPENIDTQNTREAVKQILAFFDKFINQLEMVLCSLDNLNFGELDLDDIVMRTESGSEIAGDKICIKGKNGELFEVGYDKRSGKFVFTMPEITELNVGTLNAAKIIKGGVEL